MNEIEEFLKRAAAMRSRQQGAQPAARRQPTPPPEAPQRGPLSRMPQAEVVMDAEVVQADEVSGSGVADYVSRHLDTGVFRERTSHLGEAVKSTDEAIESHLHQTFEHRLGQLGASTSLAEDSTLDDDENAARQATKPQATGIDLQSLLQSPQNFRNAFVLSEIMNLPRDRW